MIKTETYDWIDDQLDEAWDDGVILLPVAHHNLLDESKIYVFIIPPTLFVGLY